jgi:CubicO group peptidase (beta-lactamase class C family)
MVRLLSNRVRSGSLVCLVAIALAGAPAASELRVGTPASVGMSAERLARLDAVMESEISSGRKAGIVVLVARKGQIVHHKAYGMADVAANRKMQTDSMVRFYSMTKPVTSVALSPSCLPNTCPTIRISCHWRRRSCIRRSSTRGQIA